MTKAVTATTVNAIRGATTAGRNLLTAADVAAQHSLLFDSAPTTEPVEPGILWLNSGVVSWSLGIPPTIDTQPQASSVDDGETATFTVVATDATSYQWQLDSGAGFANVEGATSPSYTTATLTTDEDGDEYRCVVTGPGGSTTTNVAVLSVLTPVALSGVDGIVAAISPQYLVPAWQTDLQPTVKVEKGYGSTVFQDLYPHTDGNLYTEANGSGSSATVFADGSTLFVETPYNQSLASAAASGHPSVVTDSSRRLILDVSIDGAPFFGGIQQGTQDASQHASERGYDLNISVTPSAGVTLFSLDQLPATGTTQYNPIQNNGGSSKSILVQPANNRWYDSAIVAVASAPSAQRGPSLKTSYQSQYGTRSNQDSGWAMLGGVQHENGSGFAPSGTSTPLRWAGPTSSLTGRSYAVIVKSGYLTQREVIFSGTITPRLYKSCQAAFAADQVSVMSPVAYQLTPMDLDTGTGNIRIVCASGAGREIEASFNGGSYSSIGTTDANGFLAGSLVGAVKGTGTLIVRVVGQATVTTISNVRVGIMVAMSGQSNAVGRGDDVTLSVARTIASNGIVNSTATQKSWMWSFLQNLGTEYSCPVAMTGFASGGSYLYYGTDGDSGHWNLDNTGTSVNNDINKYIDTLMLSGPPNFAIWHQGESDALGGVTEAQYKAALIQMWEGYQSRTGYNNKLKIMQIGRDGSVADANVDEIRTALVNVVADRPDLFEFGGCLAHLPVEDALDAGQNVHFYTQSQKDAVVAVFRRHALGSGRAHRYSSGVIVGDEATLTFTGGTGSLTVGANPIGFTCSDSTGALTVSGVTASGSTLTLTFNRSVVGSLIVKWLSHYSGIGTTITDSDATTPLPPEPFEVTI